MIFNQKKIQKWGFNFFAIRQVVKFAEQRLAEEKPQVCNTLQNREGEHAAFQTPCPSETVRIYFFIIII